ncbi:MAG: hypothetical protein NTU59_06705 [Coprothermobacterota bacterium]|nr:hypothetical protein [Coprothermobacterota bacterium]
MGENPAGHPCQDQVGRGEQRIGERYQSVDPARDTAGFRTNRTMTRTFPRELASEAIIVTGQILWPLLGEGLSGQG